MLVSTASRLSLAWVFVSGGLNVLRDPERPARAADDLLSATREHAPVPLPPDTTLVRANAAVQVVAGAALALGVKPRLAATALLGTLVPATLGGHPFWQHEDPAQRAQQQIHFNKNLGLAGGLLLVVLTGGG